MLILPDEPLPITAFSKVSETMVNEAAAVAPKLTPVASARFFPFMIIVSPVLPAAGVNELITGGNIAKLFTQLEVLPVSAELVSVAVLSFAVRSKSETTPGLLAEAIPWLKL